MLNVATAKRTQGLDRGAQSKRLNKHSTSHGIDVDRRTKSYATFTGEMRNILGGSKRFLRAKKQTKPGSEPMLGILKEQRAVSDSKPGPADDLPLLGVGLQDQDQKLITDSDLWFQSYQNKYKLEMAKRERVEAMRKQEDKEMTWSIRSEVAVAEKTLESWGIDPKSRLYRTYELIIVMFVLYNAVFLPMNIAFWEKHNAPSWIKPLDSLSDLIFWFDLVVNFFKWHEDEWGVVHRSPRVVFKAYLLTWFPVDFLACFPFEVFVPSHLATAAAMAKCIRLLRLAKILRFMDRFHFGGSIRVLRLVCSVVLLCHWIACFWFYLGEQLLDETGCSVELRETGRFARLSDTRLTMSSCSWLVLHHLDSDSVPVKSLYLKALYWSVTTIMTVGYGDFHPVHTVEHYFYVLVILVGAVVYANFFSIIVSVIESANSNSNAYAVWMEDIREQMHYLRFPQALRSKILNYFEYQHVRFKYLDCGREVFYRRHATTVGCDIAERLFLERVKLVYFLKGCSENFLKHVVRELTVMVAVPTEKLCQEGDHADAWFIIEKGSCRVLKVRDGVKWVVKILEPGDQFGEISLLTGSPRSATVQAVTYCDLLYVSVQKFYVLLDLYQEDAKRILETCACELVQFGGTESSLGSTGAFLLSSFEQPNHPRKESAIGMPASPMGSLVSDDLTLMASAVSRDSETDEFLQRSDQ